MEKFTILYLLLLTTVICLYWSESVKEDTGAYSLLKIIGWGAGTWGVVYGLYHVVMELLRS